MFDAIALFALRSVYRAALDRDGSDALDRALDEADRMADLLEEVAWSARYAPVGIPLVLAPFGASDTDAAPLRAAVAAVILRERVREVRQTRGNPLSAQLLLQHAV